MSVYPPPRNVSAKMSLREGHALTGGVSMGTRHEGDPSVPMLVAVAFGVSWLCWGARAALATIGAVNVTDAAAQALFFVGGFGPTIAALAVRDDIRSWGGLRAFLFGGTVRSAGWFALLVIGAALAFGLTSAGLNPAIPLASVPTVLLAAVTVSGGMSEELGWRGVLQPELERRLPYAAATLATGAIWAVWHLPLWLTPGDSHVGFPFVLFAAQAILLSYWLAGLRRRGGAVLWCCVLHGAVNTLMSVFVLQLGVPLVAGLLAVTALSVWMGVSPSHDSGGSPPPSS